MYKNETEVNRVVNKKRAVIQSSSSLTLLEQNVYNLFQYVLTKSYKQSYSTQCVIPYIAFRHFLGSKLPGSRKNVIEVLSGLQRKNIVFDIIKKSEEFYGESDTDTCGFPLLAGFKVPSNEAENIVIDIPPMLMEIIRTNQKHQYTPVLLQVAKDAKNKYTPRVYDYIMSFAEEEEGKDINIKNLPIEDFRSICGVEEGQYKTVAELKRGVINPAQKECSKKFNLDFSFDFVRVGRKVTHISISFDKKSQIKALKFANSKKPISLKEDIFITESRKHATEVNLKEFTAELSRFNSFSSVESLERSLHYKIVLKDGSYILANFNEIKELIDYVRFPENISSTPKLLSELNPVHPDVFDPSIVKVENFVNQ